MYRLTALTAGRHAPPFTPTDGAGGSVQQARFPRISFPMLSRPQASSRFLAANVAGVLLLYAAVNIGPKGANSPSVAPPRCPATPAVGKLHSDLRARGPLRSRSRARWFDALVLTITHQAGCYHSGESFFKGNVVEHLVVDFQIAPGQTSG